jgi:hypothetical protein
LSLLTRLRRPSPAKAEPAATEPAAEPGPAGRAPRLRTGLAAALTALAGLLVVAALIAPSRLSQLTPGALLRIPAEGLAGVALLLILPARARRVVAVLAGVLLGLLVIWKVVDIGFTAVLARRFHPVFDLSLLGAALDFLRDSYGQAGATLAMIAAGGLAAAALAVMPLAVLRLTRVLARHRLAATRAVAGLAVAWVACALLGAQVVADVPVAAHNLQRIVDLGVDLRDRRAFAEESAVDAFAGVPSTQLLTRLRGKDVVFVFVESYGRDAVEDPAFAAPVGSVLDAGGRELSAAGFESRSAFLTSPTFGGASWLAHATLLSGLWVDNQQRHDTLIRTDRLNLNTAFARAGWRTAAVMPGAIEEWGPEADFYGYDRIYDNASLGYQGPRTNWGKIPDQYTMSAFQHGERATPDHPPVMAEVALVSSHGPWTPVTRLIGWEEVGDGTVFEHVPTDGPDPEAVLGDGGEARAAYGRAIGYSLRTVISYVAEYGDDDLVLVVLGDHQPAALVVGDDASHDVPISIIAGDPAVLDRISGWGWQPGLRPGPQAPISRMDTFRDQFLTAFGP